MINNSNKIERFQENPILSPQQISPSKKELKVECILNPGVFEFQNKTWLLLRVAESAASREGVVTFPLMNEKGEIDVIEIDIADKDLDISDPRVLNYKGADYLTTISHFRLLSSNDGVHFKEEPDFPPIFGNGESERYGIEDCRVTQIGDSYYLTYTAVSSQGVGVGMMSTKNWKDFTRYGLILPPHNKDCTLFDEKINGKYYMLHRPSSPEIGGNYIWIAESEDLIHWGKHKCIAQTRTGMWDSVRVGAGASPVKTKYGWLEVYHGANEKNRYCLGAILLDLDDPSKVLARSVTPVMEPKESYEMKGFFGEVIFTNGHVRKGDNLTVYYGAADSVICGANISITSILKSLNII
ncbi:MAG: glycoside hydrolase family 130 protein [Prolixibacteraceae bacterium]|jgi:predicted GH43/DUF377 family glycosyl hydrolase|nr:glycoside hydrolase family 130 protein [Prolixibacteraceae bacterium]